MLSLSKHGAGFFNGLASTPRRGSRKEVFIPEHT